MLSNGPPNTAFWVGSLTEVRLLKLLPLALAILVHSLDHGEAGGKLKDILGETLFSDGGSSFVGHLAQPVGVAPTMSSTGSPHNLLDAADLPFCGDHLWEVKESSISAKG